MTLHIGTKYRISKATYNGYTWSETMFYLEKAVGVKTRWFFKPETVWQTIGRSRDPKELENVDRFEKQFEREEKIKAERRDMLKKLDAQYPKEFVVMREIEDEQADNETTP